MFGDLVELERKRNEEDEKMRWWYGVMCELWRNRQVFVTQINEQITLPAAGEEYWGRYQLMASSSLGILDNMTPQEWYPAGFAYATDMYDESTGFGTRFAQPEDVDYWLGRTNDMGQPRDGYIGDDLYYECYDQSYNDETQPDSPGVVVTIIVPFFDTDERNPVTFTDVVENYIQSQRNSSNLTFRINSIRNAELAARRDMLRNEKIARKVLPLAITKPEIADYLQMPEGSPERNAFDAGRNSILCVGGKYKSSGNQRMLDELIDDVNERVKIGYAKGVVNSPEDAYEFIQKEVIAASAQGMFKDKDISFISEFVSRLTAKVFSKIKKQKPLLPEDIQKILSTMSDDDAMDIINKHNLLKTHSVARELKQRINACRTRRRNQPIPDPFQTTLDTCGKKIVLKKSDVIRLKRMKKKKEIEEKIKEMNKVKEEEKVEEEEEEEEEEDGIIKLD